MSSMKKVLTASANETVISTVKKACQKYSSYFDCDVFSDTEKVIEYIDYELPEIKVLDFSTDAVDAHRILGEIDEDAWLHYGGIVAVCRDESQVAEIESKKDANIIAVQTIEDFEKNFTQILRILWQNQQFLFIRGIKDEIGGEVTGSFVCENDLVDIHFYTNLLVSYLYNTNRISGEKRVNLQTVMIELLTNALEHGNLEITGEEKADWLEKGGRIDMLVAEKAANPAYSKRKIRITYSIGKDTSVFTVTDDGDGFAWKKFVDGAGKFVGGKKAGKGIQSALAMVKKLEYNEKGNSVSFEVENLSNTSNTIPGIMKSFKTEVYMDKQVVCKENELGNDLFFIVSGRFAVYVGKKLVSVLTPNDMFIGEMAFLLNDRRSATILAVGACRLIRIPKAAFLTMMRKNPHYGIFLSKMLAERLQKQTQKIVEMQTRLNEI